MNRRSAFLAGERPDDVLVYLADDVLTNPGALEPYAESVPGGHVLVVPGEEARRLFGEVAGIDPMAFASDASDTDGDVAPDLTDGTCPDGPGVGHQVRFVFGFAEAENAEAGGLYAEGDVVHAYAACTCGQTYADRWVVGERDIGS